MVPYSQAWVLLCFSNLRNPHRISDLSVQLWSSILPFLFPPFIVFAKLYWYFLPCYYPYEFLKGKIDSTQRCLDEQPISCTGWTPCFEMFWYRRENFQCIAQPGYKISVGELLFTIFGRSESVPVPLEYKWQKLSWLPVEELYQGVSGDILTW